MEDLNKVQYINKKQKIEEQKDLNDPAVFCQFIENELEIVAGKSTAFLLEGEEAKSDEEEPPPEDEVPDLPENQAVREFLKNAPRKGLHMPLGTEVKVMQCWRCKAYGHRTGDRECPLAKSGNERIESYRQAREDPMARFASADNQAQDEKLERVEQLKLLIETIRREEKERKKRKKEKKHKDHKDKKHKKSKS